MPISESNRKICTQCGKDVTFTKRVRNPDGGFSCEVCAAKQPTTAAQIMPVKEEKLVASKWFYMRDGQKCGPLAGAALKRLADEGRLKPTDMIWRTGMANWTPVSSVKEIFSSYRPTTTSGPSLKSGPKPSILRLDRTDVPSTSARPATKHEGDSDLFPCPICGGRFATLETDEKGICPQCARQQDTAPPLAASSGSKDSVPTFWNTELGLATAIGIPLVLILGIAIGWASWSAHSRQQVARQVSDMQQEADQLLTAGDASGASEKYAKLLKYMEINDVTDGSTHDEVLAEKARADAKVAQIAAANAAKQVAQHVSEMRQDAGRLLTAGDPIAASQEYAQLVDYMDSNGFTNNDTRSEVLQEKANADAKSAPILAANAEKQRLEEEAAAQRAAADAAKQQEEERAAEALRQQEQAAAEEAARQQKEQAAIEARYPDAYTMSQEFVKDQLKSPATAQFQPYDSPKVSVTYSDGWYTVDAAVDAQNGFGALIRSTYICKLKPIGGNQWQADNTFILDN